MSSCSAWNIWFMTGSFDSDVHSVSTWLVSVVKIAVAVEGVVLCTLEEGC